MIDPDVTEATTVRVTEWSGVRRVDVCELGSRRPSGSLAVAQRTSWSDAQVDRLCESLESIAAAHGGGFDSWAEWLVTYAADYDGARMRDSRRDLFSDDYRSAITTVGWADPDGPWSARIQATAYIPSTPDVMFAQRLWRPRSLYDTESMALAPAVVTDLPDCQLLHISGVVAWDDDNRPVLTTSPDDQLRHVYRVIESVLAEAGGSKEQICRLRAFCPSDAAAAVRAQAVEAWGATTRPSLMIADGTPFGPGLFAEIQVMAILGRSDAPVAHENLDALGGRPGLTVHVAHTPAADVFAIGEIRPAAGRGPDHANALASEIDMIMSVLDLAPEDVQVALVYAGPEVGDDVRRSLATCLPPDCLHVVHCRAMLEDGGVPLKAELTARRPSNRVRLESSS